MNDFLLLISEDAKKYINGKLSGKTLKIRIKDSGCSGYKYVLDYVENNNEDIIVSGVKINIIEKDKHIINNSLIDIKKEGLNTKIIFDNPQSYNECGCGESFSVRK